MKWVKETGQIEKENEACWIRTYNLVIVRPLNHHEGQKRDIFDFSVT